MTHSFLLQYGHLTLIVSVLTSTYTRGHKHPTLLFFPAVMGPGESGVIVIWEFMTEGKEAIIQ